MPVIEATCIDENELQAYATGALPEALRQRVEAHLRSCDVCTMLVASAADALATIPCSVEPEVEEGVQGSALAPGEQFGRFRIEGVVGRGGWGTVYRAEDTELGRPVAIKVMSPRRVAPGDTRALAARLRTEARAMARLAHPNVVTLHDVGSFDEQAFVVMELVSGSNLRAWLNRQERDWREILRVFSDAGRGLVAAHEVGIVHRDFKPENVLIGDDGRARVTDFGLARSFDPLARGPAPGFIASSAQHSTLAGTPAYMAPEQILGKPVDARTDQFSFCVSLYLALFARHPFLGRSHKGVEAAELLRATLAGSVHEPAHGPVSRVVLDAILRGLSSDPEQRWRSLAELISVLDQTASSPVSSKRPWGALALATIGGLVVFASFAAFRSASGQEPTPLPLAEKSAAPAALTLASPDPAPLPTTPPEVAVAAASSEATEAPRKSTTRRSSAKSAPLAKATGSSGAKADQLLNPFRREHTQSR